MKQIAEDADHTAPLEIQVSQPSSPAYSICAWMLMLFLLTSSQNGLHHAPLTFLGESDTAQAKLSKAIGEVESR